MQTRRLGPLEVSAIGLGCMGMSQSYGAADPAQAEATLLRALELGISFFDTANVYGLGHNETLVGRVLRPYRERIVVATKFGIQAGPKGPTGVEGDPAVVPLRCDESLQRLGIDVIDLYYLHRVDPRVPIEETVAAMAELVSAGKVRALGLSEVDAPTLRRAHAVHPIAAVQSEYSLWTRDPEREVLGACSELGVGFVPFSPLGRGFLTGTLASPAAFGERDLRRRLPRFQPGNFERNRALVAQLERFAQSRGATPAQVALAWVLARGPQVVPIPGTKRVARLEENAAAVGIALTRAEVEELSGVFAPDAVAGARYPEALLKALRTQGSQEGR